MSSIVGIDEVGRGPWAGPLVVGAVVLGDAVIEGLTDSKKLTKRRREELSKQIIKNVNGWGIGWADAAELDEIGLAAALTLATCRALEQITVPYHEIIIDGTVNFLAETGKGPYVTTMKKADLLIPSVSAASIIAKVARDDYMSDQDETFPGYGFGRHVGYGTAAHMIAIDQLGLTPLHRKSFAPIAVRFGRKPMVKTIDGTNKQLSQVAESAAAKWLKDQNFVIVKRNWKSKFCEIDIIAEKSNRLYFVEVKYRRSSDQAGGLSTITPKKLRQMRFAASLYVTKQTNGKDASLAAAVVFKKGSEVVVDQFLVIE